ncbi:MAG: hypothetical protein AAF702_28145 [Chloroflexota bacterium]
MKTLQNIFNRLEEIGVPVTEPCTPEDLKGSKKLMKNVLALVNKFGVSLEKKDNYLWLQNGKVQFRVRKRQENVLYVGCRILGKDLYSPDNGVAEMFVWIREDELVPIELNQPYHLLTSCTKWSHILEKPVSPDELSQCNLEAQHLLTDLANTWATRLEEDEWLNESKLIEKQDS